MNPQCLGREKFKKLINYFENICYLPDPPVHPSTRVDNIHKIIFFKFSVNIFIKFYLFYYATYVLTQYTALV